MKKILLVTRPIAPPWDEASKNFAYHLAQNIKDFEFFLLTNGILPGLPENIRQKPIYTSNKFTYLQKIRLTKHLRKLRKDADILHYIFTTAKQNSFIIKNFIEKRGKNLSGKHPKSIQTIATLREDLYSDKEIKKLIFGDVVITYSKHANDKLSQLGFKEVKQIYPGIDLNLYSPTPKNQELMKKFNFSADDFIINFTGEYSRLGAIDDVINSFVTVSQKIPNAKLSLAVRIKNEKDAEKKKEIIEILKQNNIFGKVAFQDDGTYQMHDIFNLCDVSLFPVRDMKGKFDVPLAVIEAMACGKPVIISDIPILSEFANGQNSVKIEAGNVEKLSENILDVYSNRGKYAELGKSARKFVEENFDIKKVAEKYNEVYKSL